MKDMVKRVREDRGGFTLAELLVVVAIIGVLVAIAIPVFTGALDNANEAVAEADIRAVKGAAATANLVNGDDFGNATELQYTGTVTPNGDVKSVVKGETAGSIVIPVGGATEKNITDIVAKIKAGEEFTITVSIVKTDLGTTP